MKKLLKVDLIRESVDLFVIMTKYLTTYSGINGANYLKQKWKEISLRNSLFMLIHNAFYIFNKGL